jgi:hypothetical protein
MQMYKVLTAKRLAWFNTEMRKKFAEILVVMIKLTFLKLHRKNKNN